MASLALLLLLLYFAISVDGSDWNTQSALGRRNKQVAEARVEQLLSNSSTSSSVAQQYVFFDLDMGGSTNILFGLVQAAIVAKLLGRTLVLPPPEPWYLKDYGVGTISGLLDEAEGKYKSSSKLRGPTTVSTFADFFDMSSTEGLGGFVPLVSFREFVERESTRLSLPWKPGVVSMASNHTACRWTRRQGLRITGRFGEGHLRGRCAIRCTASSLELSCLTPFCPFFAPTADTTSPTRTHTALPIVSRTNHPGGSTRRGRTSVSMQRTTSGSRE
jgi:hypothetical protein